MSLYTLFSWSFTSCLLTLWLQFHACSLILAMFNVCLCVYKLCFLCKHLSNSHTKSYEMSGRFCHGHSVIYLKCHTCFSHPLVNHTKNMLSCSFTVSCRQDMLSVCSQGHVYTSSLVHTLNYFSNDLSTGPPSISQTSTKLHWAVSSLRDQELLPIIAQSLRLPSKQSALQNPRINFTDCHLE